MSEDAGAVLGRRTSILGATVVVVLGLSVWVQTAVTPQSENLTSLGHTLGMALPLIAVFGGVIARSAVMLLAIFPMTLLPPMLLASDGGAVFAEPWSALRVAVSLAVYLGVVSAWVGATGAPTARAESKRRNPFSAAVRGHVQRRIPVLVLWWAVPTYAIFWDGAVVGTLQQQFGDGAGTAQIFVSVLVFFGWVVTAYMLFIVPTLNLEYDYRRYVRGATAFAVVTQQDVIRRLLWTFGGTTLVTLLLLAIV